MNKYFQIARTSRNSLLGTSPISETSVTATEFEPTTSYFLKKKLYIRKKQVVSALGTIYFGSPQLGHKIKPNYIKFQAVDPEPCSNLII